MNLNIASGVSKMTAGRVQRRLTVVFVLNKVSHGHGAIASFVPQGIQREPLEELLWVREAHVVPSFASIFTPINVELAVLVAGS